MFFVVVRKIHKEPEVAMKNYIEQLGAKRNHRAKGSHKKSWRDIGSHEKPY